MEPQMHRSPGENRDGGEHVVRYTLAMLLLLALGTMTIIYLWNAG